MPDKAIALFGLLTNNALPITAGAVGGGAAGVGVMQGQVRRVKEKLDEQAAQTAAAQAEASQAQSALRSAEAQLSQRPIPVPTTPAPMTANPLEQIQGIGPVFARKLHEAGVVSMADLAAQTPEQVRAILATVRGGKMINAQAWIDQARHLLGKLDNA